MATATRKDADYELTLTLSRREAEVLFFILRQIGGLGSGPRGSVESISDALRSVRVCERKFDTDETHNTIYFV